MYSTVYIIRGEQIEIEPLILRTNHIWFQLHCVLAHILLWQINMTLLEIVRPAEITWIIIIIVLNDCSISWSLAVEKILWIRVTFEFDGSVFRKSSLTVLFAHFHIGFFFVCWTYEGEKNSTQSSWPGPINSSSGKDELKKKTPQFIERIYDFSNQCRNTAPVVWLPANESPKRQIKTRIWHAKYYRSMMKPI